jgi:hypothetical protein
MISPAFNFDYFVRSVKDLEFGEIKNSVQSEIGAVDTKTGAHVTGAKVARTRGAPEYAELLRGLRHILHEGTRPSNLCEWDLVRMKPVIESLVRRNIVRDAALLIFGNA